MPDTIQFYSNVVNALQAAKKANDIMTAKVASQAKEIEDLKAHKTEGSDNYKELVSKLASAGVIDNLNEAYLKHNVNDGNLPEFITKLASLIEDKPVKQAGNTPYEVSAVTSTATAPTGDKYLEECNKRLRDIHAGR